MKKETGGGIVKIAQGEAEKERYTCLMCEPARDKALKISLKNGRGKLTPGLLLLDTGIE